MKNISGIGNSYVSKIKQILRKNSAQYLDESVFQTSYTPI